MVMSDGRRGLVTKLPRGWVNLAIDGGGAVVTRRRMMICEDKYEADLRKVELVQDARDAALDVATAETRALVLAPT